MAVAEIHPDLTDLEAFTLGTLDSASLPAIEAHVAGCPACQERAASVSGDNLIELLRRAHARMARQSDTVTETAAQAQTPAPVTAAALGLETAIFVPAELAQHERYRVVRLLGEGGMGSVYEAEHLVMQRPVALKVVNRAYTARPAVVERFRREVRAAARLSHPNIVTAFDADNAGDTHFLVMELVEGVSLGRLVKERGPLPVAEACEYVRQAALGLQHAHERGMVHRDVKPDNLIRCADGTVKVLDFGLAALTAERTGNLGGLTDANLVMGTPDYMAPEQAENASGADIRADVYSLGCTLYYLLTGSVPYPAATPLLKILAHREQPQPSLRRARPEVPPGLATIVARMLEKKPEQRYQTPAEVAAALEPFARPRQEKKRPSSWLGIAAAFLLATVLGAGVIVHRILTDYGELVITTESDDVEVIVKGDGKVRVIDTRTNKSITLRSGVYELELKDGGEGLKLSIDRATLTRGATVLAKIERVGKPNTPVPVEASDVITPLHHIRWAEGIADTSLSADGRYVVAWRRGGQGIRVWETQSGKMVFERNPGAVARFTPDSKHLVTSEKFSDVHVYDLATGKQVREFDTQTQMYNIGYPAGTRLIYWTPQGGQIWDWTTGKKLCDFPMTERDWTVLTPDGRHIFQQVGQKPPLRVLDAATGKEVDAYRQLRDIPRLNFVTLDGKHQTNYAGRTVTMYETATGKEVGKVDLGPSGWCRMGGTGRRILTDNNQRDELRLLDTTGRLLGRLRFPEPIDLSRIVGFISADDRYASVITADGSVYVFRLPDPPEPAKDGEVRCFEGHAGGVWDVALSADGSLALSVGGHDQTARLWKVATGEQLYCFEGLREDNLGVAFSPDSRTAFCSSGGEVRSWDVATGKERAPLRSQPDCARIRSLAISDDGRKLLAGGVRAAVLFDLQTGKELQRLDKSGWIHSAALSRDATQILTGADVPTEGCPPLMRLWDAKTGQEIRRFAGPTGRIHEVAFSPDGKRCVSCGAFGDNTLRVFDMASGKELFSIPHPGWIGHGAFLPDGQRFLTACGDGVVYLWDVRNGQKLHSFKGHKGQVNAVAVSRDGRYALTGSMDKTLRLWRLPDPPPAKENP
jgi:WD40 repeat protein